VRNPTRSSLALAAAYERNLLFRRHLQRVPRVSGNYDPFVESPILAAAAAAPAPPRAGIALPIGKPPRRKASPMTAIANRSDVIGPAQWLVCRAGSHVCAMPLIQVAETMRALPIEAVSGAPAGVRGLAVIRGAPVPVVDLGLVLGASASRAARFVTIKAEARSIALAVDAIVGIRAFSAEECNALPPLLRDAATATITGIGARDAELMLFLSAARIMPPDLLAGIDAERAA
jgi:purine-binding chemotaxis protein CheW